MTKSQATLFEPQASPQPLAEALRPQHFSDVVGQAVLGEESGAIARMVAARHFQSIILWGPAGCGKTTIARLIAKESGYVMEVLSAVQSGLADVKKVFDRAEARKQMGQQTLLFVDEIHRFNRTQQDAFLPVLEDGTIVLIGATTENTSFELNAALLSRCRVVVLDRLNEEALMQLLVRSAAHAGRPLPLDDAARKLLCQMADGDGRALLNLAEALLHSGEIQPLDCAGLLQLLQRRSATYDKGQDSHYNLISALHKSLRGSDVDAALYWFARMLEGGEDPLYIARRLVRFASEDIGMADPNALVQALAARQSYEQLGSPEGELAITQAVIYLATAPKSNAQYMAYKQARRAAKDYGSLPPPAHILNAPTQLMKNLGYGVGYAYDHDTEEGFSGQNYFPADIERQQYYRPLERGFERDIGKRLDYWEKLRAGKKEPQA